MVKITERKTKRDETIFLEEKAGKYKKAEKITPMRNNLNTHEPGVLYESFPPEPTKMPK